MIYNPDIHHRKSIRLKGYDYSQAGAYYVTLCTQNWKCLFGDIIDGQMVLNDAGRVVLAVLNDLPNHYSHVKLDQCMVMPNHVHGIMVIVGMEYMGSDIVGAGLKPAPTITSRTIPAPTGNIKRHGLPEIVRAWKTFSARHINEIRKTPGTKLWQRNYYEHIIRNENELNGIREYIIYNPKKWDFDRNNPAVRAGNVGAGLKPAPTISIQSELAPTLPTKTKPDPTVQSISLSTSNNTPQCEEQS